jgi:hypothetical protein
MRGCFCPNMAIVAVENPLLGEAGLICEQHYCRKFGLLFNLVHKPMNKLVSTKVIIGACLHHLPMKRTELLLAYNVSQTTMIYNDHMTNHAVACAWIFLKRL